FEHRAEPHTRPVDMVLCWSATATEWPAIAQPDMVVTYEGLGDAIISVGQRAEQLGLDIREPVAVCIENPAKLLSVCLALLHCGFSTCPVTRRDLLYLQSARIKTVIYETQGLILSGGRNI